MTIARLTLRRGNSTVCWLTKPVSHGAFYTRPKRISVADLSLLLRRWTEGGWHKRDPGLSAADPITHEIAKRSMVCRKGSCRQMRIPFQHLCTPVIKERRDERLDLTHAAPRGISTFRGSEMGRRYRLIDIDTPLHIQGPVCQIRAYQSYVAWHVKGLGKSQWGCRSRIRFPEERLGVMKVWR